MIHDKKRFYILSPNCRIMNICGIDIIGNLKTNILIGLDTEGSALIKKLSNGNPIVFSRLTSNEKQLLSELTNSGFFDDSPDYHFVENAYFHVTGHCNLNCPGCYSFETNRNSVLDLSLEKIKQLIDNMVRAGITSVVISGGEPFLRNDLEDIVLYLRTKIPSGFIECITNGSAPIERYFYVSKYVNVLTFSLDSADEGSAIIRSKDVFETVVGKINEFTKKDISPSIVFTIHHKNINSCEKMSQLANSLGIEHRFSILTVKESEIYDPSLKLTSEDYELLCDLASKPTNTLIMKDSLGYSDLGCIDSCGAGKNMIAISHNGDIFPCHMFIGESIFVMGNALKDEIVDIVNNKNSIIYDVNVDQIPNCRNCNTRYVCGGGCRFRAYCSNLDVYGKDPLCNAYKKEKEMIVKAMSGIE